MKTLQTLMKTLVVSLLLVGCNNSDELTVLDQKLETNSINKKEVTLDFIDLMKDVAFKDMTLGLLKEQKPSVVMSKILEEGAKTGAVHQKAYNSLSKRATQSESRSVAESDSDKLEILEVWMHNPKNNVDFSNVLFSFAPEGNEKDWSVIEAYTMNKEVVYLDVKNPPKQPVIVIETDGFETLKKEVEYMNAQLRLEGVQNARLAGGKMAFKSNSAAHEGDHDGIQTTKLDKISLDNDEEPWIKGAAEIYAITSGIRGGEDGNKPEIKVIPMYYLDYEGTDYYPNQILLFWDDYGYEAANIQLFEKDDNINYKDLVTTIVNGVFQIIGTVSTQPWVNVLGQVAGAIIQAMPNSWYTDSDDYVDSFYTVQKYETYTDYRGARGNAKVNMSPFFLDYN
ncbi:DUF3103 family protein [Tenacibaculum maritimum]|uniref:DUF3103 family protein n=2 Tax=Tenacibaculum maritimum TaxID=107401 RepID=UPI0038778969